MRRSASERRSAARPDPRALALALAVACALPLAACDVVFPEREGFDVVTGGGGGGGGGGGDDGDEQIYGYDEGCNCSQGFRYDDELGGRQYTCFASGGTWREARDNCVRQGMRLVVPSDGDESDFVADLCGEKGDEPERWWIGVQDVLAEGEFRDEADGALAWDAWPDEGPAADDALDCALMDRKGRWQVASCLDKHAYVCASPRSDVPVVAVGETCRQLGSGDGCGGAQRCFEADAARGVGVCTWPCASDAECVDGTRCTTTPAGRLCLSRCEDTVECNVDLRCIHTPSGDGVCWTQGAESGEVQTSPEIVLDHIEFVTGSGGGWPRPGEQSVLHVFVRNDGDGDAFDAQGTVSPTGALYVDDLSDEAGRLISIIPAGGEPVEIVTPTVTLSSDLPLGTPARFLLTVNAGASQTWQIEFGVTAYPSAAQPYVTEVDLGEVAAIAPGAAAGVSLYAENLGFAAVSGVTCDVVVDDGQATWTAGQPLTATFQDPQVNPNFAPQRVAEGTLAVDAAHPAGVPVTLFVTLSEPGGTVWQQTVAVPTAE